MRVSYALNADDLSDVNTYIDEQCLLVGDSLAKYYSAFLSRRDSLTYAWVKANPDAPGWKHWMGNGGKLPDCWSEYQYSELFKEGDELTVYSRMPRAFERFDCWHKEAYPLQQWSIQDDTQTICGYLCQKATCTFRGRDFEAWFAPDIPVGMGPWKFGGLPGLILKVYDTDHLYTFECVGIAQGKFPITKYDYTKYKREKRARVLQLQRKFNEEYMVIISKNAVDNNGQPVKHTPKPYEPLELE